MSEMERVELNDLETEEVVGGKTYYVHGTKHFLALRSDTCYDDSNIIGKFHNGDRVEVYEKYGTYWLVEGKNGRLGYVNSNYLRRYK